MNRNDVHDGGNHQHEKEWQMQYVPKGKQPFREAQVSDLTNLAKVTTQIPPDYLNFLFFLSIG